MIDPSRPARVRGPLAGLLAAGAVALAAAAGAQPAGAAPAKPENAVPSTLTAKFSPEMIAPGGASDLGLTLHDDTDDDSTGLGYTFTLPDGVTLVGTGTARYDNTCSGTVDVAGSGGATTVTLAGGSVYAHEDCMLTLHVTSSISGDYAVSESSFSALTDNASATGASATLTVDKLPGLLPYFDDPSVDVPGSTWLTLRLTRRDDDTSWSVPDISYTATLPTGLKIGTGTIPSGIGYCPGVEATEGGTTVAVAGANLPDPGDSCRVRVPISVTTGGTWQAADFTLDVTAGVAELDTTADVSCATMDCGSRTLTAVLPTPAAPVLTGGVSSLTATWQAPTGVTGIIGYRVVAQPGPATCTTTGALTCVLGATAGQTYTVTVITRTAGADSAASPNSNEAIATAPVAPPEPPATDLTLTTDKGDINRAEPGQNIVVIGTGFAAHSTVTINLYSSPIQLGTVVTDGNGNFAKPVTIPADLATGLHTAIAQGVAPDGTPRAMKLAITVTPRAASILPVTGPAVSGLLTLALVLLAAGAGLVLLGRTRGPVAA
ncbi:hypothetical protein [Dactylosporangium sp. CA-092794]|uniref:DUF7933 domain-containing protein n=1 Tax=Dactylosporangium sp. CA-092794 TaxID=3239929 RepID=UPI003D90282A